MIVNYLISAFLMTQSFTGVQDLPADLDNWTIEKKWDKSQGKLTMVLSKEISKIKCDKDNLLVFPKILYAHQIGRTNSTRTEINKKTMPKFVYGNLTMRCSDLLREESNSKIFWTINAYSKYFAIIKTMPVLAKNDTKNKLIHILYISSTISLFFLSIIFLIAFSNKENFITTLSISLSAFFLAGYCFWNEAGTFQIDWQIHLIHKIGDLFLFLGFFALLFAFYKKDLITVKPIKFLLICALIGAIIIIIGPNGDIIQLGTSVPFIAVFICLGKIIINSFKNFIKNNNYFILFDLTFATLFAFLTISEILAVSGISSTVSLFPFGVLLALLIFSIGLNRDIQTTYKERDDLLKTMESKVVDRTNELYLALKEKEIAQAELIQSTKLASLGTLSAGIAHEINNSINYVNACIFGLEKQIKIALQPEHPTFEKIQKLIKTIKHGSKMTMEIVKSLRSYTGLNQAEQKEVLFDEIINSVTTIANSKLSNVTIEKKYNKNLSLWCSVVGMNQVVMNLLTNASDAIKFKGGKISIEAKIIENNIFFFSISDNGSGIPESSLNKIFDPFYTTKEVGSGTGLGLYIIKNEVEKNHNGSLTVESKVDCGTTFSIKIPKQTQKTEIAS